MIPTVLHQFAFFPVWSKHIEELARMALPEPWKFRSELCEPRHLPILDQYLRSLYRVLAEERNAERDEARTNGYILVGREWAYFNTGLLTPHYHSIFAAFQKNKREGLVPDWFFKGWCDESSTFLRHVSALPLRPSAALQTEICAFRPAWKVRININHILSDPENLERIPAQFRPMRGLSLLLETAAARARRLADVCPSLAVPQFFNGKMQYLLPVCMEDPEQTDLVMALQPMDGYYQCVTCLTPKMAYCNARLLGRPTVPWLTSLVQ